MDDGFIFGTGAPPESGVMADEGIVILQFALRRETIKVVKLGFRRIRIGRTLRSVKKQRKDYGDDEGDGDDG